MAKPVIVQLTWGDVTQAGLTAISRTVVSLKNGCRHRHGYDALGADNAWLGAIGEAATAKFRNCYWSAFERGAVDVGGDVEVRAVPDIERRLILHDDDRDVPFVLAVVEYLKLPQVTLAGWFMAGAGKRKEWREDPTGKGRWAFFVPNAVLEDMADLPLAARGGGRG